MNPWIKIWANTTLTIDQTRTTKWADRYGMIPFFLMGMNKAQASSSGLYELIGIDSYGLMLVIILLYGILTVILFYFISINVVFYFGKIWKGAASRKDIFTVISLCLIPQILLSIELLFKGIIHRGNFDQIDNSYVLIFICGLISIRILIIGISRVQRFSYGIAVLNVFLPQLILSISYLFSRGF